MNPIAIIRSWFAAPAYRESVRVGLITAAGILALDLILRALG